MAELLKSEMRGLDPCPFCGGEAKLCKDVWPTGNGTYARAYWVRCKRCKACSDEYKSADDAAQAWNQRDDARWHSVDEPGQPPVDQALLVCVSGKPRENITLHHAIELATCDPSDPGFWILSEWPDWQQAEVSHWMALPDAPGGSHGP